MAANNYDTMTSHVGAASFDVREARRPVSKVTVQDVLAILGDQTVGVSIAPHSKLMLPVKAKVDQPA